MWVSPVFNRTSSDVTYLKDIVNKIKAGGYHSLATEEKTYWVNALVKGALNSEDLNRIEDNIKYISELLISLGKTNTIVSRGTSWTKNDIMYKPDLDRIVSNFNIIMNKTYEFDNTIKYNVTSYPIYWNRYLLTDTWESLQDGFTWYQLIMNWIKIEIFENFMLKVDNMNVLEEMISIMKNDLE